MSGDDHKTHYHYYTNVIRNMSAVTAACLLTRRSLFWAVDGFDEARFPLAFQDVDYCLKVREFGHHVVYTPYAKLYHYESRTKSAQQYDPTALESRWLYKKWKKVIARDPYYSPNLRRDGPNHDLNMQPR